MKTTDTYAGDLGLRIIDELNKRGVSFPKPDVLPTLPATWRNFTIDLEGKVEHLGFKTEDCSAAELSRFCLALFESFRDRNRYHNDGQDTFCFNLAIGPCHFNATSSGLVIMFTPVGISLTVAECEDGLLVGFADVKGLPIKAGVNR